MVSALVPYKRVDLAIEACRLAGVPYAQVRAVSNVVERRNRAAWNVAEAVDALAAAARAILELA